jgi:hypothetical protein
MEDYSKYTPTQLLKIANDICLKHNELKQEIINNSIQLEELEKLIEHKLKLFEELEKNYVAVVEELNK